MSPNIFKELMCHTLQVPYHVFIWNVFLFLAKSKFYYKSKNFLMLSALCIIYNILVNMAFKVAFYLL